MHANPIVQSRGMLKITCWLRDHGNPPGSAYPLDFGEIFKRRIEVDHITVAIDIAIIVVDAVIVVAGVLSKGGMHATTGEKRRGQRERGETDRLSRSTSLPWRVVGEIRRLLIVRRAFYFYDSNEVTPVFPGMQKTAPLTWHIESEQENRIQTSKDKHSTGSKLEQRTSSQPCTNKTSP